MTPTTLYGRRVIVSPHARPVPVLQISPSFEWCSDEFRAKFNAWLLDRFGSVDPVYEMPDGAIVMSTEMYRRLYAEVGAQLLGLQ